MGELGAGSVTSGGTTGELVAAFVDSAATCANREIHLRQPDPFYENTEVLPMTTIDQQLAHFLTRLSKIKSTGEDIHGKTYDAESDMRDCVGSTIETLERDINYAADKANAAHDLTGDLLDMLDELETAALELNPRLTTGAQPPAELKPRHVRFLKVLKKNNGCTVAHMAGTLGIGLPAVYSYVHDLKRLGHKVAIKKKHLFLHDLITNINPPVNSTGTTEEA
jgi:hypothetical protein